jgi:AcrR family transcriptional regulator
MSDRTTSAEQSGPPSGVTPFPGLRNRTRTRAQLRARLAEAMLLLSGERGYERVTIQDTIERAGSSRATFYKHFADKEDCFAQAYGEAGEWLYWRLTGAAKRQPGWREGLRVALAELLEFCANQPAIARSLFVEAHAVGGRAVAQHDQLMERLSHAIDSARREPDSRHSPPPITAAFIVGAIETLVRAKLMDGDGKRAPELLPGILHFVVMQYFGEDAAWEEMTSAPRATWNSRRSAAGEIP